MSTTKYLTLLLLSFMLISNTALAGRPLEIDDADPIEAGEIQIETGVVYERDSNYKHWDFQMDLTYGILPSVEVGIGFGGQSEERKEADENDFCMLKIKEHGVTDLTLGGKWQFIESCYLGARHTIKPSVKIPTADEDKELGSGKADCDLTWIISRSFGEKMSIHLNLGYTWAGGPCNDVLHYGVALDYSIVDSLQWVGEIYFENENSGDGADAGQYNTGLRWDPVEGLTLDFALGSKLQGEALDLIATTGLTWVF